MPFKKGCIPWNKGLKGYMAGEKHYRWRGGIEDPEKRKARCKRYREKHRDEINARARKHYKENRGEELQRLRDYYSNPENRKKHNDSTRRWHEKYPEKRSANCMKYIASKKQAIPPIVNLEKIKEFYKEARRLTKETNIPHHVDHIIPLSRGGLHHEGNLQVLTMLENCRKSNKLET